MSRARELAGFATATNPIQDLNVGVVTAISFSGDGSSLTGIDATSIKDGGGTVRAQANTSGVVVTGILTATSLEGDGSALTGLPAGLGTAVAATGDGANIYYTNQVLDLGSSLSVDVPATAVVAYTQYPEIAVASGVDLTIADGDDFVSDILGIGTTGAPSPLAGGGGRIRADNFTDRGGSNAPTFPNGVNITGVCSATDFSGTGLSPADFPNGITGVAATFTGSVSVGGTLTYEDVTNVDSTGIVTAKGGVRIPNDTATITLGAGADLELFHNATNSHVRNQTGDLILDCNNGGSSKLRAKIGEEGVVVVPDGEVSLWYDGSKKFETTSGGVSITGDSTSSGEVIDQLGGSVRRAIQSTKSSSYTLVATDSGKHINISTGGVEVPNSVLIAGAMVTIVNNSGSDQTITQGSGVTMYLPSDASTGNRTLAGRGVCTILFTSGSICYISGAGLS